MQTARVNELVQQHECNDAWPTLQAAVQELAQMESLCAQAEHRVAEAHHEADRRKDEMLEALHRANRLRLKIGQLKRALRMGRDAGPPSDDAPSTPRYPVRNFA